MTDIDSVLSTLTFGRTDGADSPSSYLSIMDCVAFVAGKANPDNRPPRCTCPVVAAIAVHASEHSSEQVRRGLALRLLRLANSSCGRTATKQRAAFLADFAFKRIVPAVLRAHSAHSSSLEQEATAAAFEALPTLAVRASYLQCARLAAALEESGPLANPVPLTAPLSDIVQQMRQNSCVAVAQSVVTLLRTFELDDDILGILDQLLAIGDVRELPLTPKVQERLRTLALAGPPPKRLRPCLKEKHTIIFVQPFPEPLPAQVLDS